MSSFNTEVPLTYTYKTWGGKERIVTCHEIRFEPAHVVFIRRERGGPRIVVAEANAQVNELTWGNQP